MLRVRACLHWASTLRARGVLLPSTTSERRWKQKLMKRAHFPRDLGPPARRLDASNKSDPLKFWFVTSEHCHNYIHNHHNHHTQP